MVERSRACSAGSGGAGSGRCAARARRAAVPPVGRLLRRQRRRCAIRAASSASGSATCCSARSAAVRSTWAPQFEYWQHTHLTIDVVPGRGGGFSLEAPRGVRFLTRSRVFSDEEVRELEQTPLLVGAQH